MYTLKTIAEKDYIEFAYNMQDLFDVMKGNCQMVVSALVAQGVIKDPDPFTLSDDNLPFFYQSCKAAVESAFNMMAQLSRELKGVLPDLTVFDVPNSSIKLNVGSKSTINEASLSGWDTAISSYLIAYVLRDWYTIFMPNGQSGLAEAAQMLNSSANQRTLSNGN